MAAATLAEKRESASLWGIHDSQKQMKDQTGSIGGDLDMMSTLAKSVGPAAKIALTSVTRLDNAAASVAEARAEIGEVSMRLAAAKLDTVSYSNAKAAMAGATKAVNGQRDAGFAALKKYKSDVGGKFATAGDNAKKINAATAKLVADMTKAVKDAVAGVKKNAVFTGSDEHCKQVSGFYPDDVQTSGAWDGKHFVSSSDRGDVKGRIFYKMQFNMNTAGWWSSNSDELFVACQGLSTYLRRADGIERDLRPPCNHYNHPRVGGMGQCIQIDHSFFSHCGGGGYWSQNLACGGIPEPELRMVVGYETLEHNYDRHLCHYTGANSHGWENAYTGQGYKYTLCTGGNSHFRTPPPM